jgi:hypothetical protein
VEGGDGVGDAGGDGGGWCNGFYSFVDWMDLSVNVFRPGVKVMMDCTACRKQKPTEMIMQVLTMLCES